MGIDYLNKLGFIKEDDINKLKVSLVKVEFDKESEFKIITADLRYFWDGLRFGLHISDWDYNIYGDLFPSLEKENLSGFCEVLYLARNNIKEFAIINTSFKNLKYLNLSGNIELLKATIINFPNLEELFVNNSPLLKNIFIEGPFPNLRKIEISNCGLVIFYLDQCRNLEYLNLSNNRIKELDLFYLRNLKFFFGKGNPVNFIKWPVNLKKISLFEIDKPEAFDESLLSILEKTDEELQISLNAYLEQLEKAHEVLVLRMKLIFIGNTTSGKSTLRRILLSKEGEEFSEVTLEEKSTHGVNVFTETLKINQTEIWIQGFDFGGQDYYHATHLPFISHNALNVLVYCDSSNSNDSRGNAYQFGIKNVEEREEILYPINYWISSLKKNKIYETVNEEREGYFIEYIKIDGKTYPRKELKVKTSKELQQVYFKESELEIVQNVRKNLIPLELNNLEIRQTSSITIGDIVSFNFHEEPIEVKKWLKEKILTHSKKRPILATDKELMDWLLMQADVIFTIPYLLKKYPNSEYYSTEKDLHEALKRLHDHIFGFYFNPGNNNQESFFINKLDTFSSWIHENILTKDLKEKLSGYFEIKELSLNEFININLINLLAFLEVNNVIFKIKNIDSEKWVAPSYLPLVKTKAEELLIDSFDKAECIFEFPNFFHSNIILMLIDRFETDLVLDVKQKQYLLWKNKVILHQKSEKSKAYLLLELKYPGDIDFKGKLPQLSISRNNSAFVNESNFHQVFEYIKESVINFEPKISIKTRFNDYIPYECLFQKNTLERKVRSNLIYHNQTIYSSFDFRHFWKGSNSEPTKIFIGYSKFDIEYVNELILHLGPYENQGDVVIFYDKDLRMGEKWDEELKFQLTHSDIFVCLVSPNMLNTKYVVDLELPLAHKHNLEIVPIILSECNWSYQKLNNGFNLLLENNAYAKAEPLPADQYSRQIIWKEIAESLKNKPSKSNESNHPNSPPPPNEQPAGHHQTDGGE